MRKNDTKKLHRYTKLFALIVMNVLLVSSLTVFFVSPVHAEDIPGIVGAEPVLEGSPTEPNAVPPPSSPIVPGDVSGDEIVDFSDINPFNYAVEHTEQEFIALYPSGSYWAGDVNQDGIVDGQDVNPFVALLSQPPVQNNVPAPPDDTPPAVQPSENAPPSESPSTNNIGSSTPQKVPNTVQVTTPSTENPTTTPDSPIESQTSEEEPQPVTIQITPVQTIQNTLVTAIEVNSEKPIPAPQATIIESSKAPTDIPPPSLDTAQRENTRYITIMLTGENNPSAYASITSMTVTIAVPKAWLTQNNIEPESITFMNYQSKSYMIGQMPILGEMLPQSDPDKWQKITPTKVYDDEQTIYYEVETTQCLSTFAIIGLEKIEVQPYQSPLPDLPWVAIIGVVIVATSLLVVMIFKGGYVYREEALLDKKLRLTQNKPHNRRNPKGIINIPSEVSKIRSHAVALKIFLNFMMTKI